MPSMPGWERSLFCSNAAPASPPRNSPCDAASSQNTHTGPGDQRQAGPVRHPLTSEPCGHLHQGLTRPCALPQQLTARVPINRDPGLKSLPSYIPARHLEKRSASAFLGLRALYNGHAAAPNANMEIKHEHADRGTGHWADWKRPPKSPPASLMETSSTVQSGAKK